MLAARRIVSSHSMGVRRTLATRIVHRRGGREVSEYLISATSSSIEKAQAQDGSGSSSLDLATYTASYLLPKGYPATVGPDYMGYSMWCATAGACASAGGVLATQSLLCAVGIGSGGASSTLPLAASLNWVLKDGIGQLAAVVSAAVISDRFDSDPKRWRAVAAARAGHAILGWLLS